MRFSKKVQSCGLSPMRKFHPYAVAAEAAGKRIYHLNIGQPDIETPPSFFHAIRDFSQQTLGYAPSPGMPQLVQAIRTYYDHLGVTFDESDVLVTAGGSEALQIVLNCILDQGDEILIPEPFYPNYNTFVRTTGAAIHPISTTAEEGYRYALREKIIPEINERTRAILFTNPGNPTGVVLSQNELQILADIAREYGLFLIADEVYREFVYQGEPITTIAALENLEENAIIIDSVSKRFSACGARVGAILSKNHELMTQAMKYCQARLSVVTLDQIASAALYAIPETYFPPIREEYKQRRDIVLKMLQEMPGVICSNPGGAFYVMAKLPVKDADDFQKWLLTDFDDHGETVMFAPGESFYATAGRGRDEIRVAYVLKQEELKRSMELLQLGLEEYLARASHG